MPLPLLRNEIRLKENLYVYEAPKQTNQIGMVLSEESYNIEKEEKNMKELWYEIKFKADHLLSSEEVRKK